MISVQLRFLVGAEHAREIDEAMQLGASAYLLKPPNPESILRVLDSLSIP